LDRCIEAGFLQPTLIRTRSAKNFFESLSELKIASHFLARGFQIQGFDSDEGNTSVPDLLATRGDLRLAIEVYTPRRWEGLNNYRDKLSDALKNLDAPFDYECSISHGPTDQFRDGRLFQFHPGVLSQQLEQPDVDDHVSAAIGGIQSQLLDGGTASASVRIPAVNLVTRITCAASATLGDSPSRVISTSGPPLSGFAPEHDFVDIARRSVRKLERGQATTVPGAIPCLVVDLSEAGFESELNNGSYQADFARTLESQFTDLRGHGIVAFTRWRSWDYPAQLFWLKRAPGIGDDVAQLWGTPLQAE
jgi:hypothetical protein